MAADIFDDIIPGNETRTPYFPELVATYRAAIESTKYLDGNGPSGNKAFIVDFKVLESSTDEVEVGEFRSKYFSLNGNEFKGALKVQRTELMTFLVAAMGYSPDAEGGAAFRARFPNGMALLEGDELNGRELTISTTLKKKGPTAKTPGNITMHAWGPCEGSAPAPAAAPPALTPPPAPGAPSTWQRSPDGVYALNPVTNAWHFVATGAPA